MADGELLVTISGPALALLLYENRRIVDQIGFFLGEILVYVTKKVTDVDREIEHTKYHIDIKSIVAYPVAEPFFNSIGQIENEKLESILGKRVENVVGWYHFREEIPKMTPSFRDRNLHEELTQFFASKNNLLAKENFVFCILTSMVSEIGGTHKFKHLLLRKQSAVFKPVSLKINNLGADASRADGSDYKPRPTRCSNYDIFDKVYSRIRKDLKNVSGVEAVTMIQDAADSLLEELIPKISKSDQKVSELENQLMALREKYFSRNYEQSKLLEKLENMEVESKSDTNSQPKSPDTIELLDIDKNPEPSGSNVKQVIREFENLEQRQRRSSTDRDLLLIKGSGECSKMEQTKCKKSAKPTHQFLQESLAKSKTSLPCTRLSISPDLDDCDT